MSESPRYMTADELRHHIIHTIEDHDLFSWQLRFTILKPQYFLGAWEDMQGPVSAYLAMRSRAPYHVSNYNCVNFSRLLQSTVYFQNYDEYQEARSPLAFAYLTGFLPDVGPHAINLWVDNNRDVWLVEPQELSPMDWSADNSPPRWNDDLQGVYSLSSGYLSGINEVNIS